MTASVSVTIPLSAVVPTYHRPKPDQIIAKTFNNQVEGLGDLVRAASSKVFVRAATYSFTVTVGAVKYVSICSVKQS